MLPEHGRSNYDRGNVNNVKKTTEEPTRINTNSGPIPVGELSYFLYLFRATYIVAMDNSLPNVSNENYTENDVHKLVEVVSRKIAHSQGHQLSLLATRRLPIDKDLTILDMKRENPIDVLFGGLSVAFATAVILSGGKFEGLGLKVELPPLGKGIRSLRDAFGQNNR